MPDNAATATDADLFDPTPAAPPSLVDRALGTTRAAPDAGAPIDDAVRVAATPRQRVMQANGAGAGPADGGDAPASGGDSYGGGSLADRVINKQLGVSGASSENGPNWFDQNRSWIIPALTGLGAMASSNSRYLGSAILQGMGAGAQAYGQERQNEAGLTNTSLEGARTAAGIGQQHAETLGQNELNALQGMVVHTKNGDMLPVRAPDGSVHLVDPQLFMYDPQYHNYAPIRPAEYMRLQGMGSPTVRAPVGGAPVGGAPVGGAPLSHPYATAATMSPAPISGGATSNVMSLLSTASPQSRQEKYQAIQRAGDTAIASIPTSAGQAINTANLVRSGLTGAAGPKLADLSSLVNQGARITGVGGEAPGTIDALASIAQKLQVGGAFMQAHNAGQNSYASFAEALNHLQPGVDMPPEAAAAIQALNLVQNQYNRDYAKFADAWTQAHPTDNLANLGLEFSKVHRPEEYTQLYHGLEDAMLRKSDPKGPTFMERIARPPVGVDPNKYYATIEQRLAQVRDAHGNRVYPPGMTRVFHQ